MIILCWAAFGALAAVVLNHLADCLPEHRPLSQRPACKCGQPYQPRQWLAVSALLMGAARCPACGTPLPARRWLFEIALALLYAVLAWRYTLSWALAAATLHASILALIVVTDLEHRVVPNAVILPAIGLTVVLTGLACPRCAPAMLLGGTLAFLLFLLLALIRPGAMGFGDVKLAAYVGLIAGYPHVLSALFLAILAGGMTAAALLLSGKGGRHTYIPYAPFLALGGAWALFFL